MILDVKVTDLSSGEVVTVAASSMKAPELFRMKEHSARAITTTYKTLEKGGIDPVCGYVFTPLISLKTKVNDWQGSTDLVWDVQIVGVDVGYNASLEEQSAQAQGMVDVDSGIHAVLDEDFTNFIDNDRQMMLCVRINSMETVEVDNDDLCSMSFSCNVRILKLAAVAIAEKYSWGR